MEMKIRYLFAVSIFALAAGSHAQAADVGAPQAEVDVSVVTVPVFNWQGFYAGGQVGGSWGRSKVQVWDARDVSKGVGDWSLKPDGFIGGLYAGYNFNTGENIVLGIDTDFLWTDVKGKVTSHDVKYRVKQKWVGSTRVRIGYAADRWLPYLAGGVAYGRFKGTAFTDNKEYSESKNRIGWTIGTGVDYAMTDNVLLRGEYRYTDFGEKSYYFADVGADHRFKYHANDFRVGVAYKF